MSYFVDEMIAMPPNQEDDRMEHSLKTVNDVDRPMDCSYESSIDMFTSDDHMSCHDDHDQQIPYHSDYSTTSSHVTVTISNSDVYKNDNDETNCHGHHRQPNDHLEDEHHQTFLMDEDDFDRTSIKTPLANEIELVFKQISHSINVGSTKQKQILTDINGFVSPGQILAVMGPSGSGKTTFLNILSGRTKPSSSFGEITLNGQRINKQLRRKICYVLQQDIFFPNLTLKQTLMYTARLRLPDSMKDNEKCSSVDKIIEELQLKNCQDTIIGDISKRGLSGGEKKRANIACELLTNPSVMLIDEPTSGLDSCTAYNLINILKNFSLKRKKTIVMSIHQPSSQMFYLLDNLLLLSNGQQAYFGNVTGVVPFFNNIGYCITLHYNPAEFILEKVKDPDCEKKIIDAAKKLLPNKPNHHHHSNKHEHSIHKNDSWKKESLKSIELQAIDTAENQVFNSNKFPNDNDSGRSSWSEPDRSSMFSQSSFIKDEQHQPQQHQHNRNNKIVSKSNDPKWPTSFLTQVKVLTERNFLEAKHRMLSKLNWIQTVVLAIIAGLIWFQIVRREETLNDIRGWMFFTTTYWMLFGLFQALVSFPAEREVINKERSSGAYRLSSYYMAKMIGELPLTIALPTVFFVISYPMLGCNSMLTFIYLWFFLIISTICAQSFGLFIGATCYDLEVSVTISALYSLSTMLFAGYYTSMPSWLSWARYLSIVYYSFQNMQMIEFSRSNILCAEHSSRYEVCNWNETLPSPALYVPYSELEPHLDIMSENTKPLPIWFNTIMLIMFLFIFRSLGYLVLRFSRKPLN